MISTVTTSTVVSVTSLVATSLAIFAAVALVALIVGKELVKDSKGSWGRLAKFSNVGILPLIIVFTVSLVFQVVALMG